MNKQRRKMLDAARKFLDQANTLIECVLDEEQDALDNLPENLQCSQQGESMEDATRELQEAVDSVHDASRHVENAMQ